MEKINIAELLKDCPKGMELDCTMLDNVTFVRVGDNRKQFPIEIKVSGLSSKYLTKEGCCYDTTLMPEAKCVIFPKGKTTWEGFVPPCKFKDGDIVFSGLNLISIFKGIKNENLHSYVSVVLSPDGNVLEINRDWWTVENIRYATKAEKGELFKVIKDKGYKWNPETKVLEELAKLNFKAGDWITNGDYTWKVISVDNFDYTLQNQLGECVEDTIDYVNKTFHLWTIQDAKDGDVLFHSDSASNGIFIFKEIVQRGTSQKVICYCDYDSEDGFCLGENHTCCWADSKILHPATKEQCNLLFQKIKEAGYKWNSETKTLEKLVEPRFKVGDRVKAIYNGCQYDIKERTDTHYTLVEVEYKFKYTEPIIEDKYWELVPNKFDLTTLKPFKSRVLVRDSSVGIWLPEFFACVCDNHDCPYMTIGGTRWKCCIPFEGNEHLMCKTDDCDEYYKTWENDNR